MKNKRRQMIITPDLQYKFFLLIILSISIPAVIFGFFTFSILDHMIEVIQPASGMVQTAIALSIKKLGLVIFGGIVTLTILLLYWTMLFSHRIAGPIYHLEKELENMIRTGQKRKIHFRKHDSFQAIADKINILLDSIPEIDTEKSKD